MAAKVAPWRKSDRPNDACCHAAGIEDANGEHVADVADAEDVPLLVAAPLLADALWCVISAHDTGALVLWRDGDFETLRVALRAAGVISDAGPECGHVGSRWVCVKARGHDRSHVYELREESKP